MAGTADLVTVEIAPGKGPFDTISAGDWDTVAKVLDYSSVAGRSAPYGTFPPRQATIVCSDPEHGLDPDLDPDLDANTPVRVTLTANGTDYVRFFGYFDDQSLKPAWPENEYVTFTCFDQGKFIGRYGNLGLGDVAAERADARFGRVLDELGVPAGLRDIGSASKVMAAANLDIDAVTAMTDCVTGEGPMAAWFVTREGSIRLDGRHCYRTRSRISTEQEFFTDNYGDMVFFAGTPYGRNPERHRSTQSLFNKATVTNALGDTSTKKNTTSITRRGPYAHPDVTTASLGSAEAYAQLIVDLFGGAPETYISQIVVAPATDGAVLERAAGLDLRDRVRVKHTRVNAASTIDKDYTIEQIVESAPSGGSYTATYTLYPTSQMDALNPQNWMVVGDATTGKVGTGVVGP